MMIVGSTTRLCHVRGVTPVHTRSHQESFADGAAPLVAPLAHTRGVPPAPAHPWDGVGSPTSAHASGHAPLRASLLHVAHTHTSAHVGALTRVHIAAHHRSGVHRRTHAHAVAPSRARAHPAHRCGGRRKEEQHRGPQANPLHPPFSVSPRSRTRRRVSASAGHAAHRAHDRLLHWGAVRTPRACTGPERKSLAHIRAPQHAHAAVRRWQQVPGAGVNPIDCYVTMAPPYTPAARTSGSGATDCRGTAPPRQRRVGSLYLRAGPSWAGVRVILRQKLSVRTAPHPTARLRVCRCVSGVWCVRSRAAHSPCIHPPPACVCVCACTRAHARTGCEWGVSARSTARLVPRTGVLRQPPHSVVFAQRWATHTCAAERGASCAAPSCRA
ncbi:hypothetical protein ABB37_05198 [Leptomonas pyrrhocoris]|uniref:Uncharacterized protein n=1 Tax=Leptomonas pyrrhocoris TaxID=157538 RepID=A0A0M9G154_LEPPY|nr:hypothetical protein ABB37_05194 [Leptomonas pyrrhocoris]XP_015658660.1 hypothetical protein ABB37_05195 [Leptomonas pyrrhocoris]XP_015658661.1 hypothetical protein ABB37_05195 [Leptomonas pyrrhocoris]XP_015658662.1 hypothetical protein ABB37_05196 [Leptomonas pyrrhocoris]XP_015658663.1 hypothetical protein ABB37_05196 [Leptomonas pyrrhocoris]XP_015658664.1 hypothetical protein ABB37_05197 [Leptomonas pyrrhocoris]XP_015658665.1 hypothetical protein ABB37_05198 [Leptomonas pyrrhocoris]KPA8|eukprot:XP_015658659.1 hypothetical protein ABB37_05194 [Leptomonas pyrrhocoris]